MSPKNASARSVQLPTADRYDLLDPVGAGGMGIVHRARDRRTGRLVAIKRPWSLDPDVSSAAFDPHAGLLRERKALSRLRHPHVVRLLGSGTDERGETFLVLELLERARSIASWAATASTAMRVAALVQMFDGLEHVHGARLAHGDVKPSNVLVTEPSPRLTSPSPAIGRVRLTDFGLACDLDQFPGPADFEENGPSSVAGSVLYLAPERAHGALASRASDMYAAGVVATQVLTGADPRTHVGPRCTLAGLRDFGVDWLDGLASDRRLDHRTAALLRRMLSRDPSRRCSAGEARAGLEAAARG